MNLPWPQLAWIGTACVLVLGPCVIVGLTVVVSRLTPSAAWHRTLWQVALLGILLLAAAEISGTSAGWVRWLRPNSPPPVASDVPATAASWDDREHAMWTDLGETGIAVPDGRDQVPGGVLSMGRTDPTDPTDRSDQIYATEPSHHDADNRGDPRPRPDWGFLLASAWLVGTAGLLLRLAVGRWRLGRFCRNQVSAADPAIQQRVRRLALRLGVARAVRVLESRCLASPIACGWFRPLIVIPSTLGDEFNPAELDAMLAHEVAHVAAGDAAWQWCADLTAAGLWWHPLVWWARRRWRVAGEMAADEACRIVPQGQDLLAACLVRLARRLEGRPWLSSLAMADPGLRSVLGQRVERLLNPPAKITSDAHRIPRRFVMATVPVVWLVLAVFCTAWAHARVPSDQGATTMKVFVLSWRQSLAAAALAAVLSPAASDTFSAAAAEGQPEAPAAKAEREGDRVEAKRERETARPEARDRREGERPREGDPRAVRREGEGDRREGPREGDRPAVRREDPSPELMQRRRQLEEQAADIRRKLETLRPEQDADARELRGALSRIEAQLRETQPRREAGEREPLMRRLEELKAAMQRAREAGNREEVERLEREGREVLQQLGERPGDRPRPEAEAGEIERRMQHLHAAVENLRAAGLNDQADALAGNAERWMRERGMPPGRPPEGPPPRGEGRERPDMAPIQAQVERAMGEMREQMQEMRRQIEEMRRHLQELSAKPPR